MKNQSVSIFILLLLCNLLLLTQISCEDTTEELIYPDREAGVREPVTAACDDNDAIRCLLPWPSNTFTRPDPESKTGLRLAIKADSLFVEDDPTSINMANGFSRVTPLMTGFKGKISDPSESVMLLLAQHDHPDYGDLVPLWTEVVTDRDESLLIAYPVRPLAANADHVVVVLKNLSSDSGEELSASHTTLLALDLITPTNEEEKQIIAYHAPTRATLGAANIDPQEVLRVWEFTTRSADDATYWLDEMRKKSEAAVASGETTVIIDVVEIPGVEGAAVVEGRLLGVPVYHNGEGLVFTEDGIPDITGTSEAYFRVVIPEGTDDYRFAMYGHGTGGTYHDSTFDREIAALGLAKVGIQFNGWTEADIPDTWLALSQMMLGTHRSTTYLLQSLADGTAIQEALSGPLGDALSSENLGELPNPAVGRRPLDVAPMWLGGSLGGCMGLVYSGAHPDINYGVLNVPGAGWTHWIPASENYILLTLFFETQYKGPINLIHALSVSQINWDPVDGASWTDVWRDGGALLIQESMGDPVLPNSGTHMVASSTHAIQVGEVLFPINGLEISNESVSRSAITQYKVQPTDTSLHIHGFGGRDTPAGIAARQQVTEFLESVLADSPMIRVPEGCTGVTEDGSCDFSGL